MKTFLHVGCGRTNKWQLKGFASYDWTEIRFDIDPDVHPDIEGTLTDMNRVPVASVDAVYSSHSIEHVFPHEVATVFREFYRVLKDDGFVVLTCPDLVSVGAAVAQGRLIEPLYESAIGPISALDVLYGHRDSLLAGKVHMAHKTGFTYETLKKELFAAGFRSNVGFARPDVFDLWIVSFKRRMSDEESIRIASGFLP